MDWPTMCVIGCPMVCATVLGWRYMARQEHAETVQQDAVGRVAAVTAQYEAAEAARRQAAALEGVRNDYHEVTRRQGAIIEKVDTGLAALATAERAREQLEAMVNRALGGR